MKRSTPKSSPLQQARPDIAAMKPYVPGIQPQGPGWIKLNTNENPYPPSPTVVEAIRAACSSDGYPLRLYPEPASSTARNEIARFHGLDPEWVCLGNGSDDLLNLLIRIFGDSSRPIASITPSYSLYQKLVEIQGAAWEEIPFSEDFSLPLKAIKQSKANLLFLTSPNAPTGVAFSADDLLNAAKSFKGILVLDETYVQFGATSGASLLQKFPRLVITRSLSKAYGLAGMRIGYALAHPDTIGLLDRVRDSYNLDRLAQAAAIAAIGDASYYQDIFERICRSRDSFTDKLNELGWFTYPSKTNFVFTRPRDAKGAEGPEIASALYRFLLDRRILVRYFDQHPLTNSFLRISIGTSEEMDSTLSAIQSWL